MKKIFFILIYLINFNLNSQSITQHPRILWLENQEVLIKENIKADQYWEGIHKKILQESSNIIKLPELERKQIGRRLLSVSREALRRVFYLSYSYRMTKDVRFLEKCESELINIANFADWNPSHFLDVAEMTMAIAIGYDWLFEDLKNDSKEKIKIAILEKGLNQSMNPKYNNWLKVSHNWNQVCNAGMTYGALAIFEDYPEISKEIINRAIESIKLPLEDYLPDGAYPEGFSYWGYGTSFHVLFLSALEKLQLIENRIEKGFQNTATYYLNMLGNSGLPFNYSDSGEGVGLNPTTFWFADKLNDPSLLFHQKNYFKDSNMVKNRILPASMIWGINLKLKNIKEPRNSYYLGNGKNPILLTRSGWNSKKDIFLGFKAGSPSVNHAHMDAGSFVLDMKGKRWAMDLPMQSYESLESKGVALWNREQNGQRWQVLRTNNFYHNTLTIDNQLQLVEGKAEFIKSINNNKFKGAVADLTPLYKNSLASAHRGVAILDNKRILVRDEVINNNNPSTFRWTMVSQAKPQKIDDNTILLTQGDQKIYLKVEGSTNFEIKFWSTDPVESFDEPNPGTIRVGFESQLKENEAANFSVLFFNKFQQIPKKSLSTW